LTRGAAAAGAAARDAAGRPADSRGDQAVRPPLLAVPGARTADRRVRRGRAPVRRLDVRHLQHHRWCGAADADLRRRLGDRGRPAGSPAPAVRRVRGGRRRLHPVPGPCAALHPAGGRVARPRRARCSGRRDRGNRLRRLAQARLPARARRLRALARRDGGTRDPVLPLDARARGRAQRRQRPGGRDRSSALRRRALAGRRARCEPPLLRPGRPSRVGPSAIEEEPRCRPTSCSRA
jgi:hypothetical protein